jgi:hypothetical protein
MVNKKRTQNLAPLMIMGTVLTIAPNFLLGLFRLPATDEPWIHIVGMLAFIWGFYFDCVISCLICDFLPRPLKGLNTISSWGSRVKAAIMAMNMANPVNKPK